MNEGMQLESQEQLQKLIEEKAPGIADNVVLRCMAKMNAEEFAYMQQLFQQPETQCIFGY